MSRITEKKRIKIFQGCFDYPVCLSWRMKTPGWGVWVFDSNQRVTLDVNESATFERFIDDLGTTSSIQDYLYKKANYELLLGYDNLEVSDIKGLEGMLTSPRVRMLVTAQNVLPPKWVTILIPTGKFITRETSLDRYSLEFTIKLPETLIQSQ